MIRKVGLYYDPRKDRPHIVRWYGEPDLDGGQKRYSKSFDSKSDAETFKAEKMVAFRKGVVWGLIPENPFGEIRPFKLVTTRWHYMTPSEYTRLLEVTPNLRTKALYALGYMAGLRFGEMVSLTWDNLDWEKGEVVIENRAATATMPPFGLKDYEARRIPLPKHTLDILRELQAKAREKMTPGSDAQAVLAS